MDLWRLIRECQIAEIEQVDPHAPKKRHYDQAYEELQFQTELLSIEMGEDIPEEARRWLRFIHWQNGPPSKGERSLQKKKRSKCSGSQANSSVRQ
jgi:hypothetical protein